MPLEETFEGQLVWEGDVYVFDLIDHPPAKTDYAWSYFVDATKKLKTYAVLQERPVKSPADAVRAAILRDYQGTEKE